MSTALSAVLKWLGNIYLVLLLMLFLYGYVKVGVERGAWEAFTTFQREWSPYALFDWVVRLVLASPGIALLVLSDRLAARRELEAR